MTQDDVDKLVVASVPNADTVLAMAIAKLAYEFYRLGIVEEREACAKIAEAYEPRCDTCPSGVANAIRARKNV